MSRNIYDYTKPLTAAERTLETLWTVNVLATFNVEFVKPIILFWKSQSNYVSSESAPLPLKIS